MTHYWGDIPFHVRRRDRGGVLGNARLCATQTPNREIQRNQAHNRYSPSTDEPLNGSTRSRRGGAGAGLRDQHLRWWQSSGGGAAWTCGAAASNIRRMHAEGGPGGNRAGENAVGRSSARLRSAYGAVAGHRQAGVRRRAPRQGRRDPGSGRVGFSIVNLATTGEIDQ